jgi:hypothetical protein
LEYRGFRNTASFREYLVHARIGIEERDYVVGIEQAAFATHRVALQDGPDVCFQRLCRELSGGVLAELGRLAISDAELAAYRAAHAPAVRGRKEPPPPPRP